MEERWGSKKDGQVMLIGRKSVVCGGWKQMVRQGDMVSLHPTDHGCFLFVWAC